MSVAYDSEPSGLSVDYLGNEKLLHSQLMRGFFRECEEPAVWIKALTTG